MVTIAHVFPQVTSLDVGFLFGQGEVLSSYQLLGTLDEMRANYSVESSVDDATLFLSLHFDDDIGHFMIAQAQYDSVQQQRLSCTHSKENNLVFDSG